MFFCFIDWEGFFEGVGFLVRVCGLGSRRISVLGLGDNMIKVEEIGETGVRKNVNGFFWLDFKLFGGGGFGWDKNGSDLVLNCRIFERFVKMFGFYLYVM